MVQTRRIGNKNEERTCWFFKHKGYEVWMPSWGGRGNGRFRSSDILGVFDVLATNKDEIVLIQVKTEATFRKKVEKEILAQPLPINIRREYWTFRTSGDVVARMYYANGEHKEYLINFDQNKYEQKN